MAPKNLLKVDESFKDKISQFFSNPVQAAGDNKNLMIYIGIGVGVGLIFIIIICCICCNRTRARKKNQKPLKATIILLNQLQECEDEVASAELKSKIHRLIDLM